MSRLGKLHSPVIGLDFLRTSLGNMRFNDPVVLQIEREGRMMYLALRVD
jgi:hypothetical protein